ncbi:hypothetical protein AAFF_G00061390 [Aldrovandia affinis]|uniref:Transmembrane protein n=1 Tax=Aldrovandia affinis TaxID=143900 RepID=A0AAD7WDW2_9TELE|nr:hypothetical protein AAFF_G00061390 [Aldrovandia affinis]
MAMTAESGGSGGASRRRDDKTRGGASDRNGSVRTCVASPYRDPDCGALARLTATRIRSSETLSSAVLVGSLSVFLALLVVKCVNWEFERTSSSSSSSSSRDNRQPGSPVYLASSCTGGELLLTWWHLVSTLFALLCAFVWVGARLIRRGVPPETVLFLLTACHLGEAAAQSLIVHGAAASASEQGEQEEEQRQQQRQLLSFTATAVVLACLASGALMVLRLAHGVSVVVFVSVVRTVSIISLSKVRASWRPYLAYAVGVLGVLLARYADKLLPLPPPPPNRGGLHGEGEEEEGCASVVTAAKEDVPVFKRRRRSSSVMSSDMAHSQPGSKSRRRTSLPCIQRDQGLGIWDLGAERTAPATKCGCARASFSIPDSPFGYGAVSLA